MALALGCHPGATLKFPQGATSPNRAFPNGGSGAMRGPFEPSDRWPAPPSGRAEEGASEQSQTNRRCAAQRLSSRRLDSCSLRNTEEAWDSTVFTEIERRDASSL